ncbi:MAG: AraC family transcriptional regulator [Gammaproteobacteria bacterium]|nr:MAG: AraC family transcriptional regulator [Gammaproteobacteria bacterium]
MQMSTLRLPDADSIVSFYEQTTGMQPDYVQLSTGPGGLTNKVVELDGVTLIWAKANGRARWRDQITDSGFQFGCMVDSQGPVKLLGREIEPNEAAVWLPGQEVDYVLEGPYLSLEIGVNELLIEERGWTPSGGPLANVPEQVMTSLVQACTTISKETLEPSPSDAAEQRDRILTLLDAALDPWHRGMEESSQSNRKDFRFRQLVRNAERFMDALAGEPLNLSDLAEHTGASRRTLHRAYQNQLGVGPRRYYELKRLSMLRSKLKRANATEHTITELATKLGFHDLGRLAGTYRRLYGEYPRETLLSPTF